MVILIPKSGVGLMWSVFTSGALGFGMPLTVEQLAIVNEYRQRPENQKYKCSVFGAPKAIRELAGLPPSDLKPPLKESAGMRCIFNCKSKDGYWTAAHMMLQMEDYADCLAALYPWCHFVTVS